MTELTLPVKEEEVVELSPALRMRLRQERLYTLISALDVAENKVVPSKTQERDLERYAQWHFGRGFETLVRESWEEIPAYPDPALEARLIHGAGG